jgi:hypothetical protein
VEPREPVREHLPAGLGQLLQRAAIEEYPLVPGAVVIADKPVEKARDRGVRSNIGQHEATTRTDDAQQLAKQRALVAEVIHTRHTDRHIGRTITEGQRQQRASGGAGGSAMIGEIGAGFMPDPVASFRQVAPPIAPPAGTSATTVPGAGGMSPLNATWYYAFRRRRPDRAPRPRRGGAAFPWPR